MSLHTLNEHKWFLLGIVLAAILAMAPFLQPNVSYHQGDWRLVHQTAPIIMKEALQQGTVPLWTNYIESGIPFYAVPDKPFSYVPFLAMLAVFNPYNALNFSLVLNLIFAGIAMYALAYYLTKNKAAACAAAVLWMLNSYLLSAPHFWRFATSWVPLVFLFSLKALHSKQWVIYSMLAGLSLSMMVHAGGTFQFFITALFLAPIFLFKFIEKRITPERTAKYAAVGVIIIVIFFGLSAIRLLPYEEWVGSTNRLDKLPMSETSKGHLTLTSAWNDLIKGDGGAQIGIIGLVMLILSIPYYQSTKEKNVLL